MDNAFKDLISEAEEREAEARVAFHKFDVDGNGTMDKDELPYCLASLGLLDGYTDAQVEEFVQKTFLSLDVDSSGGLSYDEFVEFYNGAVRRTHVLDLMETKEVFYCLCSFKTFKRRDGLNIEEGDWLKKSMSKEVWCKMCKDAGLLSKAFNTHGAEGVFERAKALGEKTIHYLQFLDAIAMLAEATGQATRDLAIKLLTMGGAEEAEVAKHIEAEKPKYAGKYAAGSSIMAAAEDTLPEEVITGVRMLFEKFCRFGAKKKSFGHDEMHDFAFFKLCRDTNLLDSHLTEKSIAVIYKRAKPKNQVMMTYMNFVSAVEMIAKEKGKTMLEVMDYLSLLKDTEPSD